MAYSYNPFTETLDIVDDLQSVTDRGATTTNAVTFNVSTPPSGIATVLDLFSGGGTVAATELGTAIGTGFYKGTVALNNGQVFYNLVGDADSRTIFGAGVSGDAYRRIKIFTSGQISWGDGTAAQDTVLYRSAANTLRTDDAFSCAGLTSTAGVAAGGAITGATSLNTLSTGIFGISSATTNSGVDITGTRPTIITTFTGATHKARTGNMGTGVQNFFTMNAAYDGANWNSDDTSLPVVVFDVSTANPGMRLRYAAAGVNPKTLSTAMQMSTAGVMQIPKLSPIADSTTAMQFFKADGTTAVMTIDTTNSRLGLGKTPAQKLDIDVGTRSTADGFYVTGNIDSNAAVYARLTNTNAAGFTTQSFYKSNGAFMDLGVAGTGTSIAGVTAGNGYIFVSGNYGFDFSTNTVKRLKITGDGLTTIGDTDQSPITAVPLTIDKSGTSDWQTISFNRMLSLPSGSRVLTQIGKAAVNNQAAWWAYYYHSTAASSYMAWGHFGKTEQMVLTNGGNLGIGITAPAYKLDVNGTGRFNGDLNVTGNINATGNLNLQNITALNINATNYSVNGTIGKTANYNMTNGSGVTCWMNFTSGLLTASNC